MTYPGSRQVTWCADLPVPAVGQVLPVADDSFRATEPGLEGIPADVPLAEIVDKSKQAVASEFKQT